MTLIDGTNGGNTSNFVAPFMQLQIVPAPGVLGLFGLAAFGLIRRRQASPRHSALEFMRETDLDTRSVLFV